MLWILLWYFAGSLALGVLLVGVRLLVNWQAARRDALDVARQVPVDHVKLDDEAVPRPRWGT